MQRALLIAFVLSLTLAADASAKTGIEFRQLPDTSKVGAAIPFTMTVWREPRGSGGHATPVRGIRPLITFRSASGRVIRVRTGRTNRYGLAQGRVRFTDNGPWNVTYEFGRRGIRVGQEFSQPIHVGTGLTQTIPATGSRPRETPASEAGLPWAWIISSASIASALLVFGMRGRRHWGAA